MLNQLSTAHCLKEGVEDIDDIALREVGMTRSIYDYLSDSGLTYHFAPPLKVMSTEEVLKEIEIPEHIKNSSLLALEGDKSIH